MTANSGKRVLVTGASKGIGQAVAVRLGALGFDVTVHFGGDAAGAERTAQTIRDAGGSADVVGFDVTNREEAKSKLEALVAEKGAYWGVVVNAGITRDKAFPAIEAEDWDKVISTSLDGFYNTLNPLVMPMVRSRKGGRIVVMSSVSGVIGNRVR